MKKRLFSCLVTAVLLAAAMVLPAYAEEGEGTPEVCTHSYGSWTNNGANHTRNCTLCGQAPESADHTWDGGSVTQAPTCIAEGTITYTCTGCGATKTETVGATGTHTFGNWTKVDENTHKRTCTGCGTEVETGSHTMDGGTITTKPTCQTTGIRTYSCTSGCGYTTTETVEKTTTHNFSAWTATENETHVRKCGDCGKEETGSHNWVGGTVVLEPTCALEGVKGYVCSVCSTEGIEVLEKLTTHTYDNVCDPDCNVCGAERDVEHKVSKVRSKNASGHWYACTACGEKIDFAKHVPGPAATEEKEQVCLACGYVMTAKLNHTHEYETELTSDETGHWYACTGCSEQKDFEAHVYDDLCDPDCNVCGHVCATAHSFSNVMLNDETSHWSTCSLCGEESEHEAHIPGPEATEESPQLCEVCGYELAPVLDHVHEGDSWESDEENHWKTCKCGETVDEGIHVWDNGSKNKDKTVTYTCLECGAEKTEGTPRAGLGWLFWVCIVVVVVCVISIIVILVIMSKQKPGKYGK